MKQHASLFYGIILVVCVALPYLNSLNNGFVYDDLLQIPREDQINFRLSDLFFKKSWGALTGPEADRPNEIVTYRPVFMLSLAMDVMWWGENPFGFHLHNFILFLLTGIFLYALCLEYSAKPRLSFLFSLLFLTQPILADTVAFVSGRTDLQMICFSFASLFFLLRASKLAGQNLSRQSLAVSLHVGLSVGFFIMALLSKEPALFIGIFIYAFLGNFLDLKSTFSKRGNIFITWTVSLVLAGYLGLRFYLIPNASAAVESNSVWDMIRVAPYVCSRYFMMFFYRAHLTFLNRYDLGIAFSHPFFWSLAVVHLAVIISTVFAYRKHRSIFWGASIFYLFLIPGLFIVAYNNTMPQRFLLFSSLGIMIMVFCGGSKILSFLRNKTYEKIFLLMIGLIILGNCGRIVARNNDYKNNETFYASAIRDVPSSVYGYGGLGVHYQKNNAFHKAEKMYRAAIHVDPGFPNTYNNLGALFTAQNRFSEAEQILKQGIMRHPNYEKNYYSLGNVYFLTGRLELARHYYLKTLSIMPQHKKALDMFQQLNKNSHNRGSDEKGAQPHFSGVQ